MIQKNAICIYLVLSATDQANAVWELTQHVREMTSEVNEHGISKKNLKYDHSDKNCRVASVNGKTDDLYFPVVLACNQALQ